jgi:subtilase family serine protease
MRIEKMQRVNLTTFNALLLVGFLGVGASGSAAVPKRLHANIDSTRTFQLKGNMRPAVAQGLAQDQGEVANSLVMPRMSIHFAPTAAQQADLDQFLTTLQQRHNSNYYKFLTPEQYAARFGVNTADLAKVTSWLESNGFSNVQVSRSRTWIGFSGSAGQVQQAFQTSVHKYLLNGEPHFANSTDPQLPHALQGMVLGLRGLNNFHMKAHVRMKPRFTSSQTGNTFVTPGDWATIYNVQPLYSAGLDGSPLVSDNTACGGVACSIVVVGQSDVLASDLASFRSAAGLPAKSVTVVVPPFGADPGVLLSSGDEGESDLDLEWANGIAKNANVLFVTSEFVQDSIQYAIDSNVAPILTTSYGLCEQDENSLELSTENALFQQANAQGMTIVSASGDGGAADCDTSTYPARFGLAVDFPASSPYVTGIGGTTLTVANTTVGGYWGAATNSTTDNISSALKYIPEVVWNDTVTVNALAASGGGASILYAKPSWQSGAGVPNDGKRDVPDISLAASPNQDGLLVCGSAADGTVFVCSNGFRDGPVTTGLVNPTGGTSAGAPSFAGVLALLVQQTGARLGNINPNLYAIADISETAFHDITSGSNIVACVVSPTLCPGGSIGYSAGVGYDQASGWGSIDASNLFAQWSQDIQLSSNPSTLTVRAGSSGTATISVSPYKNFTGTVSFSCAVSSSLAGVTCSLPSTTVNTSGSTTLTVNASSSARTPFWYRFHTLPPAGLGLLLLGLVMTMSLFLVRKQRMVLVCASAAVLLLLLGAVSCGGGSSSGGINSTPESGTVTVTATSGKIVNSISIAVNVP